MRPEHKQKRLGMTIENKILAAVLFICVLSVLCFGILLFYNGYNKKLTQEKQTGEALVGDICSNIDTLWRLTDTATILEVCTNPKDAGLHLYDSAGAPLIGQVAYDLLPAGDIVAESTDNALGWHVCYVVDRAEFDAALLEDQKYIIIATIALLIITVQVGVFVSYNISEPVRRLAEVCRAISRNPADAAPGQVESYAARHDEIGQLADSFGRMLAEMGVYTAALARQKALNESIVENLPTGIIAYTRAGEVLCANNKALSMLAADEFTAGGRSLRQIVEHTLSHEQVLHDPIRLTGPEGKVRDYQLGVWRLGDGADPEWGALCTIDDITYNKMMEEKVSESEKLAYTGKIAAMLAHEIRNPLAGIRASIQVISRRLEAERDQLLCTSMVHEVDRVNLLIEDLLNLARKRESHKAFIQIVPLFEEIDMLYSKIAENKEITIRACAAPGLALYADESELKQVLVNLINNSIKAMPRGGTIALAAQAAGGGIIITITDDGTGMDEEKLRAVQANMTAGGGGKGGYGLAIAGRLLAQNGGEFTMESAPGQGTCITIAFTKQGEQHEHHSI